MNISRQFLLSLCSSTRGGSIERKVLSTDAGARSAVLLLQTGDKAGLRRKVGTGLFYFIFLKKEGMGFCNLPF